MSVTALIDEVEKSCQADSISLGKLVDAFQGGAYGALLLFPALIVLCPASLIPGISALCALIVIAACVQAFTGSRSIWLPNRIRNISFNSRKTLRLLARLRGAARRVDRLCARRCEFMTHGLAEKAATLAGAGLGVSTLVFSLVPFADMLLMFPVVLFGLGLCAGDGLLIGLGWGFLAMMISLWSFIF